ncbi:MAG: ferredoxin [Candidatus Cloacimonetes bacterium HGW-Cloacimonetes-1]|nr:MAG: ferredoxin [Candidatus Cloacimonetes bacterium HGW-Cloacimonetes-1]
MVFGFSACKKATVTEYHIDRASCNGCGNCIQACPYDAIIYDSDQKAVIDQSKCRQCGECVPVCPQNAVY